MVDIWIDNRFYLVQVENELVGISLINEQTSPFDTIPDQIFKDIFSFRQSFEAILIQ